MIKCIVKVNQETTLERKLQKRKYLDRQREQKYITE